MGFNDAHEEARMQEPMLQKPQQQVAQSDNAEQEWSTGLYDCCSQPGGGALGCVSMFMPFVQFGILAQHLPEGSVWQAGSFGGAAASFLCLDIVASLSYCAVWPGISLVPTSALLHLQMRSHLRKKYGIKGTTCGDLCTAWWCGPCALAQETREVVIQAARQQQQQPAVAAGTPPPVTLMGNMLVPGTAVPPTYHTAPAATQAAPHAVAPLAPATGFPVPAVPVHVPTQVVTVTLEREAAK